MENQVTVQSYTRNKQAHVAPQESHNEIAYVMLAAIGISMVVVYASFFIPLGLTLGAAYGVKTLVQSNARISVVEAVTEPQDTPKPKRHYEHRISVHHYQTKKVIRV